jgi:hypothetical protein
MKMLVLAACCALAGNAARADEAARCQANGGTYLSGTVVRGPQFRHGHRRDGIELSHTHLALLSDGDRQTYDVAIDNVFAAGYDAAGETVPAPLSAIRSGDRVAVCGKPYADSGVPGIDWVHTDCGERPTPYRPDGWLKVIAANGSPGPNLEASREYCHIWP